MTSSHSDTNATTQHQQRHHSTSTPSSIRQGTANCFTLHLKWRSWSMEVTMLPAPLPLPLARRGWKRIRSPWVRWQRCCYSCVQMQRLQTTSTQAKGCCGAVLKLTCARKKQASLQPFKYHDVAEYGVRLSLPPGVQSARKRKAGQAFKQQCINLSFLIQMRCLLVCSNTLMTLYIYL